MEVRDGERFVPDEAWRICSTHRAGSLVEASIIAYPSSATSVLHKLFDFAKRRAVELHWDHETRFARNLRQLFIGRSLDGICSGGGTGYRRIFQSALIQWLDRGLVDDELLLRTQWTMRIVY